MKIGVVLDSLKMDFESSLKQAKKLNIDGIQVAVRDGFVFHENMTEQEKRDVRHMLDDNGITVSAICGDIGHTMFYYPNNHVKEIEYEKKLLELAKDFGTSIVTTHIGVIPDEENCWQYETMFNVCKSLSTYAENIGCSFAIETGPERAIVLKRFLDNIASKGARVNYDPANICMCSGENPVTGVEILKDYIIHTHAKDGKMLKKVDTKTIYAPDEYGVKSVAWGVDEPYLEVPLGEGFVGFDSYIKALQKIGYDGFLTIEREVGENPVKDIDMASKFLRNILGK